MSHCNHNRAKFSTAVAATLQLGELRQRVPGVLDGLDPGRDVENAVALGGSVDGSGRLGWQFGRRLGGGAGWRR